MGSDDVGIVVGSGDIDPGCGGRPGDIVGTGRRDDAFGRTAEKRILGKKGNPGLGVEGSGGEKAMGVTEGVGKGGEAAGSKVSDIDFLKGNHVGIDPREHVDGRFVSGGSGFVQTEPDIEGGDPQWSGNGTGDQESPKNGGEEDSGGHFDRKRRGLNAAGGSGMSRIPWRYCSIFKGGCD